MAAFPPLLESCITVVLDRFESGGIVFEFLGWDDIRSIAILDNRHLGIVTLHRVLVNQLYRDRFWWAFLDPQEYQLAWTPTTSP